MNPEPEQPSGLTSWRLHQLEANLSEQKGLLEEIRDRVNEIDVELRAYKRAARILAAAASIVGVVLGWLLKALGKG